MLFRNGIDKGDDYVFFNVWFVYKENVKLLK